MKLVLLLLCVLGTVVVAQETSSTATPTPAMESDVGIDPIFDAYENKAKELYVKALIDYYHAHPSRLDDDLSRLTTPEYEVFVPSELLQEFHIDKAKLEEKIKENDRMTDNNDETDVQAQEEEEDNQMETNAENDFETSQFGRFGRGLFGFGFRRFGFPYGGFYGGGFGFPYGGGFGGKKGGYGGYGGYGFPYGGFGYGGFGFRRFGFL